VTTRRLVAAARTVSRAQAKLLKALLDVSDLFPVAESAVLEVAAALAWTKPATAIQLSQAHEVMRRLPAVGESLAAGDIDLPRARVIADAVSTLDDEIARRVAEQVLPSAPKMTTGQLRARLAKMVIAADPDTAVKRHKRRVSGRRVVFEPGHDGCANVLGLDLSAEEAVRASTNISRLARQLKAAGDPRSMDQLRADTFVRLLCGESTGRGSVELTCSLPTLAQLSRNPGALAGYGPVVAEIARNVASQQAKSAWTYTVRDPSSGNVFHGTVRSRPDRPPGGKADPGGPAGPVVPEGAKEPRRRSRNGSSDGGSSSAGNSGTAGAAGRGSGGGNPEAARKAPAGVRREVVARDRTCRAPGCRVPATACDLDHTKPWGAGGETVSANLIPLCRFHHRARHEGGWRYKRQANGVVTWRSPLGNIYHTYPEQDDDPP
jgi:hypothetical protein